MKKQLLIISGVVLAVAVGIMFYFISIPNNTSAAFPGAHNGNRCQGTATAEDGSTYSFDWPCSSIQEGGFVNCTEGATGAGSCSWGAYTGTQGTDVYFTQAHANAFLQGGGTADQLNAIDGIYVACQNLIASKPVDPTMDPRAVSCDNVKWACRPDGSLGCQRIDNGNWIGNPYHPETTACNQSNGYGGHCGGSTDGLGCGFTTGGGATGTTVTAAGIPAEFSGDGTITTTLRPGSTGAQVATLQQYLTGQGFFTGTVDGKFGPGTEAAVKAWQASVKLKVDGVWGSQAESVARMLITANPDPKARGYVAWGGCSNGVRQCNLYYGNGTIANAGIDSSLCQPHPGPTCGDTIQR